MGGGPAAPLSPGRGRSHSHEPVPPPPKELSRTARSIWRRLARGLVAHGRLTALDRDQLALYCDALAKLWEASESLDVGLLVPVRRDPVRTTPVWKVYRELLATCRVLGGDLGLTPGARSRLALTDGCVPGPSATAVPNGRSSTVPQE